MAVLSGLDKGLFRQWMEPAYVDQSAFDIVLFEEYFGSYVAQIKAVGLAHNAQLSSAALDIDISVLKSAIRGAELVFVGP